MRTIQDFRLLSKNQIIKLALIEFMLFIFAFGLGLLVTANESLLFSYDNKLFYSFFVNLLCLAFIYGFLTSVSMLVVGLYKKVMNIYLQEQFLRCFAAMLILFFVLNNLSYWVEDFDAGKYVWASSILFSYLFLIISRTVFHVMTKNSSLTSNTVILGVGNKALQLKNDIEDGKIMQSVIVGYIYKPGERERLPRDRIIDVSLGNKNNKNVLLEYCKQKNIDTIVVAVDDRRNNFPSYELLECKYHGINILEVMEFYEQELGQENLDLLDPSWIIYTNKLHHSKQYDMNKRGFDLFLAIILLVITAPIMFLAAMIIKLTTGFSNNIFDRKEYVGLHGVTYSKYQFNCLTANRTKSFIGYLLDTTKINLLPELINIIKGDVSFIGPQAIEKSIVDLLSNDLWYYKQRYTARPGLFSWGYSQINFSKISEFKEILYLAKQQLQYDLFYIKKRNLLLDILLLLHRTTTLNLFMSNSKIDEVSLRI